MLTCAKIHSIELDRKCTQRFPCGAIANTLSHVADEGGATHMSGGIPWLTLPAGYLGSSFIGAALITCGFDENASKVACLVLAAFFLFTLWWARREILYVCLRVVIHTRNLIYEQNVGPHSRHVRPDRAILVRCRRRCTSIFRMLQSPRYGLVADAEGRFCSSVLCHVFTSCGM